MKIAIVRERADGETRVAATPETVGKLIGLGASVSIEAGRRAAARVSPTPTMRRPARRWRERRRRRSRTPTSC